MGRKLVEIDARELGEERHNQSSSASKSTGIVSNGNNYDSSVVIWAGLTKLMPIKCGNGRGGVPHGVAPQSGVRGIPDGLRAYIPKDPSIPKGNPLPFTKLRVIAMDNIFKGYLKKNKQSGEWEINDGFFFRFYERDAYNFPFSTQEA